MSVRRLVLMGSGETAPTMIRVHRRILDDSPGRACMLDTPFGFQTNADDLVAKMQGYFAESLGRTVELASWRTSDAPVIDQERTLASLQSAQWVFAGPGSPSYTLRQWMGTPIASALPDVVRRGGTVCLGSAAAVVCGEFAMPVYEIYKAGADPHWLAGLDLLGALTGIRATVIPHYNNNEGGHYDTRFCYIGERRLEQLESQLPEGVGILGIDEHTAAIVDIDAGIIDVVGSGAVTLRIAGQSTELRDGESVAVAQVVALFSGASATIDAGRDAHTVAGGETAPADTAVTSLRSVADSLNDSFVDAIARRSVDDAIAAMLDLEQALSDWSRDMQQGDADYARRVLRSMIVRLGEVAVAGAADPRDSVAPYVGLLLEIRARAREAKDFATSDLVRDRLGDAGVDVRDTPDGATWSLR